MESPVSLFFASGRLAPKLFALGVGAVYGLSFLSQVLISPPMIARGGFYTFAVVQIALTWTWYALHAKRLCDAALPLGSARAIAILYALAIILLLLVIEPILGPDASAMGVQTKRTGFADLWVFLLLFVALAGPSEWGIFHISALGMLALILVPIGIAIGFSVWAGTRPRVLPAQEATSASSP